jgi:N-acetylmuramoyl-L-alanine amidase
MSKGILEAIGLWWERLHVFGDDTVQHAGVVSRWKRDLVPVGEAVVQPGELVELHVTVPPDLALPTPNPGVRFDVLEFDWLFWSGTDDPIESLRTPGAADPVGGFVVRERTLVDRSYTAAEPTLEAVVGGFRSSRPTDFDTSVLVVRDLDNGWKDIVAWWRIPVVDDREPRAYFVVELPGPDPEHVVRDGSSAQLRVAQAATAGASVRVHGTVVDSVVDQGEAAQPVLLAVVALGGRTARSTADGRYVIDARLGVGDAPLTIARPGINTRTYTVRTTVRGDGGVDVAVLDEQGVVRGNGAVAPGTAEPATVRLDVSALVHRVSGTIVWPDTRIVTNPPAAPLTLAGRRVCAVRLDGGPMRPKMPVTSRDWDAIRGRPDVLRSARPGRPGRREATAADGRFELSFVDLQRDAHYLIWVEATDPRDANRQVPDAIVRTIPTPGMRREDGQFIAGTANPPRHTFTPLASDRRVVVASGLLSGRIESALDVVEVVETAPQGAASILRLLRGRPSNLAGIDANPPVDVDRIAVDAVTRRVTGLEIEVLPLVPVFEASENRSPTAAHAHAELSRVLDARFGRGYFASSVRWVLDARRVPVAPWDGATACALLERTLLTHPSLGAAQIHHPTWGWWRADAVSVADFARIDQQPNAVFANRGVDEEFIPLLVGPAPRLLGLFERRHVHVSPGHGVFASPAASRTYQTDRGTWVGYGPEIENWGGESENTAGIARFVRQIAEANGVRITVSRETDPTVPGIEQQQNGAFAAVDPTRPADHDHPRLWQQNAYYWLAAVYDQAPGPGGAIVIGNPVAAGSAIGAYSEGINRKVTVFERQAADPTHPVDVFVAIHTNASGAAVRGFLALYLDIRNQPADPAPGQPGYVEANHEHNSQALGFARRLVAEIGADVQFRDRGVTSYFVNGNPVKELRDTIEHYRDGTAVQGVRASTDRNNPNGPVVLAQQVVFPAPGGRTVPVGYVEVGFHSNTDDAAALAQAWFRRALSIGVARACELELRQRTDALTGPDVIALLRAMFGSVPAVEGLGTGAAPLGAGAVTAAAADAAITTVTGRPSAVAAPTLDAVITSIEAAAAVATRNEAVRLIARALAPRAGFAVADLDVDVANPLPAPANDAERARRAAVANAVVRPLILALGATIPAAAVPAMAQLHRGGRPLTRAAAAALLAAGIGVRPGDLATITRPINGVTLLAPTQRAEQPDACVPISAVEAAATAIATLRLTDTYRLLAVRAVDNRGNDLVTPLASGRDVYLAIETGGAAWPASPSQVTFVLRRAGAPDVTLACAVRRDDSLMTEVWQAPAAAGAAEFSLTATIEHPGKGKQTLLPVRFSITVGQA